MHTSLRYFDCHARIGPRPDKHRRTRWCVDHLLADMDLAEISGALVCHALAGTCDPLCGNFQRLVAWALP
ncbi:MAG: hypothetical protein AB1505_24790 [Candidatus Latescibacterota bacterium]